MRLPVDVDVGQGRTNVNLLSLVVVVDSLSLSTLIFCSIFSIFINNDEGGSHQTRVKY